MAQLFHRSSNTLAKASILATFLVVGGLLFAALQMEWCLECHRQPEKYLRPHRVMATADDPKTQDDQIFNMAYQQPTSINPVTLPDGTKFDSQEALGNYLKQANHVRSVTDMTNCNTCHR